jgi:hypothetical protein
LNTFWIGLIVFSLMAGVLGLLPILAAVRAWRYKHRNWAVFIIVLTPFILGLLLALLSAFLKPEKRWLLESKDDIRPYFPPEIPDEKRRQRRILAIVFSAIFVLGGGICGALTTERDLAAAPFEQSQMMACDEFEVPEEMTGVEPGSKLLIVTGRSTLVSPHRLHFELPDDLRAESSEEVDYLICFNLMARQRQVCHYDDGSTVRRMQRFYDIYAVDPVSGSSVANGWIDGDLPRTCPESRTSGIDGEIRGSNPSLTQEALFEVIESFFTNQ